MSFLRKSRRFEDKDCRQIIRETPISRLRILRQRRHQLNCNTLRSIQAVKHSLLLIGVSINPYLSFYIDLPPKKWTQRRVGVSINTGS